MNDNWKRHVPSSREIVDEPGGSSGPRFETRDFGELVLVIREQPKLYEWEIFLDRVDGPSLREGYSYDDQTAGISARERAIMDVEEAARRLFGRDQELSSDALEAARKEGFETGVKEGVRAVAIHFEWRAKELRDQADYLTKVSTVIRGESHGICDRTSYSRNSDKG